MTLERRERTLCIVISGAGPAAHAGTLIELARRDGWDVNVVASPMAMTMISADELSALSGHPVRHDYRQPGIKAPRSSAADAFIVAPATYNFVNKLALGINDTYALNVVAEAIGRRRPVVILPFVNAALAAREPFERSVESLRREGLEILYGPGQWEPHPVGSGDEQLLTFPWHKALLSLSR